MMNRIELQNRKQRFIDFVWDGLRLDIFILLTFGCIILVHLHWIKLDIGNIFIAIVALLVNLFWVMIVSYKIWWKLNFIEYCKQPNVRM